MVCDAAAAIQCESLAALDGSDARRRNHVRIRRCPEIETAAKLLARGSATQPTDYDLLDELRQDQVSSQFVEVAGLVNSADDEHV